MTPWLTVATCIRPGHPDRMSRLGPTLQAACERAANPQDILWQVYPQEGGPWNLAEKQRHAIRTCTTPWVFILSDDVECQTPFWDEVFKQATTDPEALVLWGDDGWLRDHLAVSACLRTDFARACLPILQEYVHYRIDDAWHHVAKVAQGLRYFPSVKFINWEVRHGQPYLPDPNAYAPDDRIYHAQAGARYVLGLQWRERVKELTQATHD